MVDPMEAARQAAYEAHRQIMDTDEAAKPIVLAYLRALQERGPSEGMRDAHFNLDLFKQGGPAFTQIIGMLIEEEETR